PTPAATAWRRGRTYGDGTGLAGRRGRLVLDHAAVVVGARAGDQPGDGEGEGHECRRRPPSHQRVPWGRRRGMPVQGMCSMKIHRRRWIDVGPKAWRAALWRGHG